MRPRNREVNIFNMSLLDILCGALGAFCFMMLVLFPYWRPGGVNAKETEQNSEEMQRELGELKKQMSQMPNGEAMMQKFTDLQNRLMQSTGQMNRAMQDLEEQKKKVAELETRNPIVFVMEWFSNKHDMDLYVQWSGVKPPEPQSPPDMNKSQGTHWKGEIRTSCKEGPCSEVWAMRDIIPNVGLKVHYKFMAANGNPGPVDVFGYYLYDGAFTRLPAAHFTAEKTEAFVGTVSVKPDYKIDFKPEPAFAEAYQKRLEQDMKPPSQ